MNSPEMCASALGEWKKINSNRNKWATFEVIRFPYFIVCMIKHGAILSDGSKEKAIEAIIWTLYDDGRYDPEIRVSFT